MGADNWGICPKCKNLNDENNRKRVLDVGKKYGKIPAEEYIKLAAEANKPIKLETTLREDYEIGTDLDGEFSVNYSCSCSVCGFKHQFKHTEVLNF